MIGNRNPKQSEAGSNIFLLQWNRYGCIDRTYVIPGLSQASEFVPTLTFVKSSIGEASNETVSAFIFGDSCYLDHFMCSAYLFEHGRCKCCPRKPYAFNRPDWPQRRRF